MTVTTTYTFEAVPPTEFIVNTDVGGDQYAQTVVGLDGDGFAVVMRSDTPGANQNQIVFYTGPADTSPRTFVYSDVISTPHLIQLTNGNVVVAWENFNSQIVISVINPLTGALIADGLALADGGIPFITTSGDDFVVLATDTSGGPGGFFFVIASADGQFQSSVSPVLDPGQIPTSLVELPGNGGLVVTYNEAGAVKVEVFNRDGSTAAGPITVDASNASAGRAVALDNGGFAVVFDDESFAGDPASAGIGLKLYDANGTDVTPGGLIRVDGTDPDSTDEYDPDITVLDNGWIVVAVARFFPFAEPGVVDSDIYVQVFDTAGNLVARESFASLSNDETTPSISVTGDGRLVATWTRADGDSAGSGVLGTVRELIRTSIADDSGETILGDDLLRDVMTGGTGDDFLSGGGGDDTLDGGVGADYMAGGSGVDRYFIDNANDVADESVAGSDGEDIIFSFAGINLTDTNQFRGEIEAAQLLGAANVHILGNALANNLVGNSGANIVNGGAGADWLRGRGGNDIYVVDNIGDVVDETLSFSDGIDLVRSIISFSLADTVRAKGPIENLTLIGADNINATGNALDNVLVGNTGANIINGAGGADTMQGGGGNDNYVVDNAGDIVDESVAGSNGTDLVRSAISFSLADAAHAKGALENLTLLGTANLNATGNALNNLIIGNSGANTLNGGLGADTMQGGAGNDNYVVENPGDIVDESVTGSSGIDTVSSAITFSLANTAQVKGSVENLTLLGTANLNATGNALNNILIGNTGANIINGAAGADTMQGGGGNDNYVVDNAGDIVDESVTGSNGIDLVRSVISFSLADAVHAKGAIENLTLLGTANLNATGNALNNLLIGNTGANIINGSGGADTMQGGGGNDNYVVDNAGDIVDESVTGSNGIDLVRSAISFSLADIAHAKGEIENLTLLGTASLNATGNTLNNLLIGNTGANIINGAGGADTMQGGAGNDNYVVDNAGDIVDESVAGSDGIDLVRSAISFSLADAAHAKGIIENLTLLGTANLNAIGNALNNLIVGNAGANILNGAGGADIMQGGAGNDNYFVDNPGDIVDESVAGSSGIDTISSTFSFNLGNAAQVKGAVENLTLLGSAAIDATGNAQNNTLTGNTGANTLNGGAGADAMLGGAGNDRYVVDNVGDVVDESTAGANGQDFVLSSISLNLLDTVHVKGNIEIVQLLGTANLNVTGSAIANRLVGNSGANIINGGAGADLMQGLAGNDTYVVDNAADVVDESLAGAAGIDAINSIFSVNLGNTAQVKGVVENVTLLGSAAINAIGNALDNALTGNTGANTLNGGAGNDTLNGGLGADIMLGGAGNDTYTVDNAGDRVDESVAGSNGQDIVLSSVSFNLANTAQAKGNIESLTLLGAAAINATGNALNNVLGGNTGNNTLNGGAGNDTLNGGLGADIMLGGAGNDNYTVDNAGDRVDESVAGSDGHDTVQSWISFSLANAAQARGSIESLTLLGSAAINATGNALNNTLIGNIGNNVLSGGEGNDTLTGGAGNDFFRLDTATGDNNVDIITDMNQAGNDTIQLARAIFTTLPLGELATNAFLIGTAAADRSDRIIYDSSTGTLWYDSDGKKLPIGDFKDDLPAVKIAMLDPGLALTAADFTIV